MSHACPSCRKLVLAVGLALSLSLATAGVAQASFGQLARFGAPGPQTAEHFSEATPLGELAPTVYTEGGTGAILLEFRPWHIIGVEPKTNDVYVVEEYKPPKETENEKYLRYLRLQEFNTKDELLGHFEFTYKTPEENYSEGENGLEGIAVDPQKERLYFLVNNRREEFVPEEEETVAGALYAFSTKLTKKNSKGEFEFEPAPGTSSKEPGVLDGPEALEAYSDEPGKALLSPHGITVDPATHQVVLLAHDDTCVVDSEEECENEELESPDEHYVAQRVNGETGKLEGRFSDTSSPLEEQSGKVGLTPATSPVVVGSEGSERLLANASLEQENAGVSSEEEILDEFPAGLSGTLVHQSLPDLAGAERAERYLSLEDGSAGGEEEVGGTLVASPEGGSVLYGLTPIDEEEAGVAKEALGISERSSSTQDPIGWTGGAEADASDECVLSPGGTNGEHVQIAAGSHGDIFVLDPEYLSVFPAKKHTPFPTRDGIIELGEGGKGCPTATVEKIEARVAGKEVTSAKTGQAVTLASFVKHGDALSVKWTIANETAHSSATVEQSEDEYQTPEVKGYAFTTEGKYKITEELATDNLNTPHVTVTKSLEVTGVTVSQPAITVNPVGETVTEGESASFSAAANGSPKPTVQWESSTNGGSSWAAIPGATLGTLIVSGARTSESGTEYRAVFSNGVGAPQTTGVATLTVNAPTPPPTTNTTPGPAPSETNPKAYVLPSIVHSPNATIASAAGVTVSASGAVSIKVSCPAGATTCIGTVTLRTLTAVNASAHAAKAKSKKAILTLATASFSVAGGGSQAVTLHLSAPARALLGHAHLLQARATVASHDPAGEKATTTKVLTLRPAKAKKKH